MNYLLVAAVLGCTIIIHELGHLLAALKLGIAVERFSIGFGPKIWKRQRGTVEYAVSLIPIGGYVLPQLSSEDDLFQYSIRSRILFHLGGPAANLVAAVPLLILYNCITYGPTLKLVFVAPWLQLVGAMWQIVSLLPRIFSDPHNLSGVVGIVAAGGQVASEWATLVAFTVMLNINLAIFNLLPLPVLDGGQMILTALEKIAPGIRRSRTILAVISWTVILGLFIFVTYQDFLRLLG